MINYAFITNEHPESVQFLRRWVSKQIWPNDEREVEDNAVFLAVFEDKSLIAVVVFHNWDPHAGVVEITGASINRRFLTRPVLDALFGYAFKVLKCQMVVARVPDNASQRHQSRIYKSYGFNDVRIPRLFGRNEDGILFLLTDDAWRASKFYRG